MRKSRDGDDGPEDPFADEPDSDDADDEGGPTDSDAGSVDGVTEPDDDDGEDDELPWLFSRDTVKGDRSRPIQFQVLEETLDAEAQAHDAVEDMVSDREVYLNDFREAAMLAAFENLDDVVAQLREWGYDR